jgi:hypothetical protein
VPNWMKWRSQELAPQIGGGCLIDGPSTPVDPHIFVEGTPTLMGIAHCMVSADQWAISDPRSHVSDRKHTLFLVAAQSDNAFATISAVYP